MAKRSRKDSEPATVKDINDLAKIISRGINTLSNQNTAIKRDVSKLKRGMAELKRDVSDIKRQLTDLKLDTPTRKEFEELEERVDKHHPIS